MTDTIKLLKLLVIASINCGDRIDFLTRMQDVTEATQEVLMQTAKEAGEDEQEQSDMAEEIAGATEEVLTFPPAGADAVLESEQRLAKVIADNQRISSEKRDLQTQLNDLNGRLSRLLDNQARSHDELSQANERLNAVLAGRADGGPGRPADSRHKTVIATLEGRLAIMETELQDLRRNNELLKIRAEKAQKLQDDFDEIKIERDRSRLGER